jgi:hypothetical protein
MSESSQKIGNNQHKVGRRTLARAPPDLQVRLTSFYKPDVPNAND